VSVGPDGTVGALGSDFTGSVSFETSTAFILIVLDLVEIIRFGLCGGIGFKVNHADAMYLSIVFQSDSKDLFSRHQTVLGDPAVLREPFPFTIKVCVSRDCLFSKQLCL
jgi:hypothetical protein